MKACQGNAVVSRVVLGAPATEPPTLLWSGMCIADDEGTMSTWSVPHHGGHIFPHHAKNLIRSASHIPLGTVPREAEHTDLLDEL